MGERTTRVGACETGAELDRRIAEKIRAQLALRVRKNALPAVNVEVRDGFVTLSGFVHSFREKTRAHRFVMALRGVRALRDLLQIKPRETLADEEVALHVRHALDAHSELPSGTAAVHVSDGVCHLNGHVRTAEEKHIAEMLAQNCRGVKSVVNKLTVNPLDEVPDEATVRVVRLALEYCKDFDTSGVAVSCSDGKVLLRGEVPSYMDRVLAEEMARIQPGVRNVENHIRITGRNGDDQ